LTLEDLPYADKIIAWAVEHGYMEAPEQDMEPLKADDAITRAEFAEIVYDIAGELENNDSTEDVSENSETLNSETDAVVEETEESAPEQE
ncbi:MAG: S-layer homology domain-containing protein, partial [Peptococcaceae bacterium]|nr:S-layer homology domain-containing protein [Peptococcaceae bacterium]